MQPLVSVIVLTYNQEDWIRTTLDSILSQKTKCSYVGDISEVILSEIEAQGLENGQEQYINNYIYSDNTDYYFTSDISEGENETLLFCDGKLFAGFDKSEYFFWEGKGEYVNMKLDMDTLTNGAHTFFAVTIENVSFLLVSTVISAAE